MDQINATNGGIWRHCSVIGSERIAGFWSECVVAQLRACNQPICQWISTRASWSAALVCGCVLLSRTSLATNEIPRGMKSNEKSRISIGFFWSSSFASRQHWHGGNFLRPCPFEWSGRSFSWNPPMKRSPGDLHWKFYTVNGDLKASEHHNRTCSASSATLAASDGYTEKFVNFTIELIHRFLRAKSERKSVPNCPIFWQVFERF